MTALLLFGIFFILVFLGLPIAISLGVSSIAVLLISGGITNLELVPDILFSSVSKFTLLAIPFFVLAGVIMDYAGISKRLIHFADVCVGHLKGGMILVTVITAIFFAAISGSGPATVAAIGGILIPALAKNGVKRETGSALVASSGAIGIVIPPSIAFIIFAVVAGDQASVSIGRLFVAGIFPGLLMGIAFVFAALYAKKRGLSSGVPGANNEVAAAIEVRKRASGKEIWKAFLDAIGGLLIPVIILGGIYGGVFTPTEAAVVAVFYGFIVGIFIYRELKIADVFKILYDAAVQTAIITFIVSTASLFAYIITTESIAETMSDTLLGLSSNPIIILLILNIILLIAGMFIDAISAFYIFVPILLPIILHFNMDPTVFGVIMTVNLAIGLFTPPVGLNLYVASGIGNVKIQSISKAIIPFVVAAVVVLLLITYIPSLSTYLPDLMGIK
ncbi:TRAP transporter large permease [Neobacillus mesonae]|uniref:TRAP transporter large permease n=1 Tax=Neobacillus mesonae TaxID=1193713 RepID=UPI00203A72E1|nr:TRAP transporter large permease [Neobacillus mesonae]MCM3568505.1 TRAP transporter large permease [Neobacillus mesonae]